MPLTQEDLQRFLEAERAALRASLPQKAAEMESLWRDGQPAALATLERMAHSLYGSAGTFGFQAVGSACKSLELAMRAWIDTGSAQSRLAAEEALAQAQREIAAL